MSINFIPNDPSAGATAPALRVQAKLANRPAGRATFSFSNTSSENTYAQGTKGFVYWQCREAALAAVVGWEGANGNFTRWQGNRRTIALRQDAGVDLNAYYDRAGVSFFHMAIQGIYKTVRHHYEQAELYFLGYQHLEKMNAPPEGRAF